MPIGPRTNAWSSEIASSIAVCVCCNSPGGGNFATVDGSKEGEGSLCDASSSSNFVVLAQTTDAKSVILEDGMVPWLFVEQTS